MLQLKKSSKFHFNLILRYLCERMGSGTVTEIWCCTAVT